jgi:hypothetical protein
MSLNEQKPERAGNVERPQSAQVAVGLDSCVLWIKTARQNGTHDSPQQAPAASK